MSTVKEQLIPDNLPPAGHARDEELKRRTDALTEQAEASPLNAIDPVKLAREDNEIMSSLGNLTDVSKADPAYVYFWEREGLPIRHRLNWFVREGDAKQPVWEVVHGTMEEALEVKDVNGYRKVGDVILMRARKDRHRKLMRYFDHLREKHALAADANVYEMAQRLGPKYVKVKDANDPSMKRAIDHAVANALANRDRDRALNEQGR